MSIYDLFVRDYIYISSKSSHINRKQLTILYAFCTAADQQ
jgi:hypothetical protein